MTLLWFAKGTAISHPGDATGYQRNSDAVLVCIGGVPKWLGGADYWSHLRRLINQNQLVERVVLLDKIPNSSLPLYYSLAKVFVLPTYYEALGKVIIEAMAAVSR